jgi:predicted nucleic acid-binding protein
MKAGLDSSVIISAVDTFDPDHEACHTLLGSGRFIVHGHALTETFSILTGGKLGVRVAASAAAAILESLASRLTIISLSEKDLLTAYAECSQRGIRGGAIYDYLHLVAARIGGANKLYTLNMADFLAFRRPGDPGVERP